VDGRGCELMAAGCGPAKAGHYMLLAVLAVPSVAHAQWTDHARVSINYGIEQPAATAFASTTTTTVYRETATIYTSYAASRGKMFDGGVLIRVKGGFGIGAAASEFSKTDAASISGTIPHPFFFNTLRPINGTASPLERSETAVHIQAAYVASTKRIDVAISGGPSFFSVSQDLVADVAYSETYPYDTATFTSATVSRVSATKLGFNVGADVGVKLSKNVGVGGLIRFSRASMTFPLTNTASGVSVDAGGVQAGGGVRFFF
jgi:hypothetical protein